jgi:hypothetical protein
VFIPAAGTVADSFFSHAGRMAIEATSAALISTVGVILTVGLLVRMISG